MTLSPPAPRRGYLAPQTERRRGSMCAARAGDLASLRSRRKVKGRLMDE